MSLFSAVHLEEHHLPGLPLSMVGLHIFLIWDHFLLKWSHGSYISLIGNVMMMMRMFSIRWAHAFGYIMAGSSMICIPIYAIWLWVNTEGTRQEVYVTIIIIISIFIIIITITSVKIKQRLQWLDEEKPPGWGCQLDMYREEMKIFQISKYLALRRQQTESTKHKKTKNNHSNKKTGGQHKHETSSRSKYLFSCWPTNETQPTPGKGIITS